MNFSFHPKRGLPVIRATEAAECGLACMVMIGSFYNHDIDLNGLRRRFPVSMAGATLKGMIDVASGLSLSSRALRVELEDLHHLKLPAVLHWNLNHFVVLSSVGSDHLILHDPSQGKVKVSLGEASRSFTGVALELEPRAEFVRLAYRKPIKLSELWAKSDGVVQTFLWIITLSVLVQIAAFAAPFQIQIIVDQSIVSGDAEILVPIATAFTALLVIQAITEGLRGWLIQVTGQQISYQMIGNLVHHLLKLPVSFFEKRHVGDIISRLGSAGAIQDIVSRGLISIVIDGAMALIAVVIMVFYSAKLTSIVALGVVLNCTLAWALFPAFRRRLESNLVERAREQSMLMETVRSAAIIKIMGKELDRESLWRNMLIRVVNSNLDIGRITVYRDFGHRIITGAVLIAVMYFGAKAVTSGNGLSLGMMLAFLSFSQTLNERAMTLLDQTTQIRSIGLHLDRLSDIVGADPENLDHTGVQVALAGGIKLTAVGFKYGAEDPDVLLDVSLTISPGDFIAISGPSGGGKTTLIKIILGLYHPTTGQIEVDDHLVTPTLWRAWRATVGVVSQDDRLLSGSIADNISFFDPEGDLEAIEHSAKSARIHDTIMRMPMGYSSLIGDMGSSLSGGQKQRILLARALYRRPQVLILDEGTANLDLETEAEIADLVQSMAITRIVVAHRPALLTRADRIARLVNGRLEWEIDRRDQPGLKPEPELSFKS